MNIWTFGLVVAGAASLGAGEPPARDAGSFAFTNVHVVHTDGRGVARDQAVHIENGRIEWVGPAADSELPGAIRTVDAGGAYLMPGLFDMHVHLIVPTDSTGYITHGVTSVFDLAGTPFIHETAQRIEAGDLVGPTVYETGPQLKTEALPVEESAIVTLTPEEGAEAVRASKRMGYGFIKVWGPISPEVFDAVMRTAREEGVRVTGHIPRTVGLEGAIDGGMDSFGHVEELLNKHFRRSVDEDALEPAARMIAEADISVITTLVTYPNIASVLEPDMDGLMQRPGMELVDPVRRILWSPDHNDYRKRGMGAPERHRDWGRDKQRIAASLHRAGVRLLAGSDAGGFELTLLPGESLHDELALLVESGLTPQEALHAATGAPASYLGVRAGSIDIGMRADIVLLDANPLEDIENVRRVRGVMLRGEWFDSEALDRLHDETVALHARTGAFVQAAMSGGAAGAMEQYERAKRDDPDQPVFERTSAALAAYVLAMGGRGEDAFGVLEIVAREHPGWYLPRFLQGGLLAMGGELDGARASLEATLEIMPGNYHARVLLERLP